MFETQVLGAQIGLPLLAEGRAYAGQYFGVVALFDPRGADRWEPRTEVDLGGCIRV